MIVGLFKILSNTFLQSVSEQLHSEWTSWDLKRCDDGVDTRDVTDDNDETR